MEFDKSLAHLSSDVTAYRNLNDTKETFIANLRHYRPSSDKGYQFFVSDNGTVEVKFLGERFWSMPVLAYLGKPEYRLVYLWKFFREIEDTHELLYTFVLDQDGQLFARGLNSIKGAGLKHIGDYSNRYVPERLVASVYLAFLNHIEI